ncbi:uncharacterized protein Dana_GF22504 [Drosophila ananassae]|uniref:Uncharacterized protein n=1 Tax=Drosophila ananassae TaxID=7217 RepID=B3MWJ4_DROAN|nr:uncharacterized protein Dana_GF22504 [Drosophila ananassae]
MSLSAGPLDSKKRWLGAEVVVEVLMLASGRPMSASQIARPTERFVEDMLEDAVRWDFVSKDEGSRYRLRDDRRQHFILYENPRMLIRVPSYVRNLNPGMCPSVKEALEKTPPPPPTTTSCDLSLEKTVFPPEDPQEPPTTSQDSQDSQVVNCAVQEPSRDRRQKAQGSHSVKKISMRRPRPLAGSRKPAKSKAKRAARKQLSPPRPSKERKVGAPRSRKSVAKRTQCSRSPKRQESGGIKRSSSTALAKKSKSIRRRSKIPESSEKLPPAPKRSARKPSAPKTAAIPEKTTTTSTTSSEPPNGFASMVEWLAFIWRKAMGFDPSPPAAAASAAAAAARDASAELDLGPERMLSLEEFCREFRSHSIIQSPPGDPYPRLDKLTPGSGATSYASLLSHPLPAGVDIQEAVMEAGEGAGRREVPGDTTKDMEEEEASSVDGTSEDDIQSSSVELLDSSISAHQDQDTEMLDLTGSVMEDASDVDTRRGRTCRKMKMKPRVPTKRRAPKVAPDSSREGSSLDANPRQTCRRMRRKPRIQAPTRRRKAPKVVPQESSTPEEAEDYKDSSTSTGDGSSSLDATSEVATKSRRTCKQMKRKPPKVLPKRRKAPKATPPDPRSSAGEVASGASCEEVEPRRPRTAKQLKNRPPKVATKRRRNPKFPPRSNPHKKHRKELPDSTTSNSPEIRTKPRRTCKQMKKKPKFRAPLKRRKSPKVVLRNPRSPAGGRIVLKLPSGAPWRESESEVLHLTSSAMDWCSSLDVTSEVEATRRRRSCREMKKKPPKISFKRRRTPKVDPQKSPVAGEISGDVPRRTAGGKEFQDSTTTTLGESSSPEVTSQRRRTCRQMKKKPPKAMAFNKPRKIPKRAGELGDETEKDNAKDNGRKCVSSDVIFLRRQPEWSLVL